MYRVYKSFALFYNYTWLDRLLTPFGPMDPCKAVIVYRLGGAMKQSSIIRGISGKSAVGARTDICIPN
jgi:hypothetical protein